MSYEMVPNKHLYIIIDEDASDFEEDSNKRRKPTLSSELFEIVTYQPLTRTSNKKPPTTEFVTRTRSYSPVAFGRNSYRTSSTTQRPTTSEPWFYDRYTRRYNWLNYYTTPPTIYDETVPDEYAKVAGSLTYSNTFESNKEKHHTTPPDEYAKISDPPSALFNALNVTHSNRNPFEKSRKAINELFNITDSDFV